MLNIGLAEKHTYIGVINERVAVVSLRASGLLTHEAAVPAGQFTGGLGRGWRASLD